MIKSYSSVADLPKNKIIRAEQIFVDNPSQTILFPVFGQSYPVHVSKIKNLNVANSFDGQHVILRVNFNCPMSIYKATAEQEGCYIKEL